jgi:ferritin-like metal-binding protein YciE
VRTVAELRSWVGRDVYDPYGERVGTIVAVERDQRTGVPEWLIVSVGEDPADRRGLPAAGAEPSGFAVRVPELAARVLASPPVGPDTPLSVEHERALAAHYGLELDTDASSTGLPRRRPARPERPPAPGPPPARPLGRRARRRLAGALRGAYAMELAGRRRLAVASRQTEDLELVHELKLHQRETDRHLERLRGRLHELGEDRSLARALLARLGARLATLRRSRDDADDVVALERREIEAYRALEALAGELGDPRTVAIARAIRADEDAAAVTLAASRPRFSEDAARARGSDDAPPFDRAATPPRT